MINERLILSLQQEPPRAPEWIRLLPVGEVALGDGREPFTVTETSLANILAAWQLRGNDLVVDYEHSTVSGAEAPAAGWIKELKQAMDGLWARVEWTDRARQYIESREYRYYSPVVTLGKDREVQDLLHVGLTNFPAIADLPPLVAKGSGQGAAAGDPQKTAGTEENDMIETLRNKLGLDAQAGEAEVLRALDDMQVQVGLWADLGRELGLENPSPAAVKGAVLAMKAGSDKLTALETELTALRQERRQDKAAAAVESAVQAGKVIPAQREWALKYAADDPEGFAAYVAAAPKVVPVAAPPADGQDKTALSPDEMQMCRALGIAPEQFKATRQTMAGNEEAL